MASSTSSMLQTCKHLMWLYLTSVHEFTSGWRRIGGGGGLADSPDLGDITSLSLAVAAASTAALELEGGAWVVEEGTNAAEGPRLFCLEDAGGRTATAACDGSRTNCI